VTLTTVIEDTRRAVSDNPAAGRAVFSTDSTLTGVTDLLAEYAEQGLRQAR
jgi:hypothetical protein